MVPLVGLDDLRAARVLLEGVSRTTPVEGLRRTLAGLDEVVLADAGAAAMLEE